jgi:predicted permease
MRYTNSRGAAAILASGAAGPAYVFFRCLFEYFRPSFQMPHMAIDEALASVMMLPMIIAGGFILSIGFNLAGAKIMGDAAEISVLARTHIVWVCVGAVAGAFIALPFSFGDDGIDPVVILSLASTAAVCAGLCRRFLGWTSEPDPQEGG